MNINRKFNAGVFKLWLYYKICVCRNTILSNTWEWDSFCWSSCLSLVAPHRGYLCWLGVQGTWRNISIFRVRTDHLISTLMTKRGQSNLWWWLPGFIPVSFLPWKWQVVPIPFQPLVWPGKCMRDSGSFPSFPSPGPVHAMITHARTLHPDVSPPISLVFINVTLDFFPKPSWRLGKLCYLWQWSGHTDVARRLLFSLFWLSLEPVEPSPGNSSYTTRKMTLNSWGNPLGLTIRKMVHLGSCP